MSITVCHFISVIFPGENSDFVHLGIACIVKRLLQRSLIQHLNSYLAVSWHSKSHAAYSDIISFRLEHVITFLWDITKKNILHWWIVHKYGS